MAPSHTRKRKSTVVVKNKRRIGHSRRRQRRDPDPAEPIAAVQLLLDRSNVEEIQERFSVSPFNGVEEFLCHVSRRLGRLRKGGMPDLEAAAKHVFRTLNAKNPREDGQKSTATDDDDQPAAPELISTELLDEMPVNFDRDEMRIECKRDVDALHINRLIKCASKRHKKQQRRVERQTAAMLDVFGDLRASNDIKRDPDQEDDNLLDCMFQDE